MCVRTTGMFRGGVPSTPSSDDDNMRNYMQEAYNAQVGGSQQSQSRAQEVFGMEDEYDPFSSYTYENPVRGKNEKTADKAGRYFLDDDNNEQFSNRLYQGDQSNPTRAARPFSGLTADQITELQGRNTALSKKILAASEAAKKGDTKKGAFGFVTDPKTGQVVGYTHRANPLGLAGLMAGLFGDESSVFQAYTGRGEFNPFDPAAVAKLQGTYQEDDNIRTEKTPLDPCPEGFKYNAETETCEKVEDETTQPTIGTNFVKNTEPMPNLSNYGQDGSGEYRFFSETPGTINARDGIPRGPHGEIIGAGGPKDDLVGPFMLSSQEYVEPYERVLDEGDGNYNKGIRVLEKKRMAALRKYSDRVKSEERNRA